MKKAKPVGPEKTDSSEELVEALDFSAENILQASSDQPRLFLRAVEFRVQCMRSRLSMENRMEAYRVDAAVRARTNAETQGVRATEAYINEKISQDEAYTRARELYQESTTSEEYAKLLMEAYRMRRDCIRVVGDLVWAERGSEKLQEAGTQQLKDVRQKIRDKYKAREE